MNDRCAWDVHAEGEYSAALGPHDAVGVRLDDFAGLPISDDTVVVNADHAVEISNKVEVVADHDQLLGKFRKHVF